jgi:hypothetical protein
MDIRLKTKVEGVHIWLPVDEAIKFLRNPKALQAEVRIMLHASNIDPETGEMREPLGFSVGIGPRPGMVPIDKPLESEAKQTKTKYKKQEKIKCEFCERMIAAGSMKRHVKAAHSIDALTEDVL